MRWKVVCDESLYCDEWLDIHLADVELPDGRHLAHRWIRTPPGAGVVAIDAGKVLLLWRHRFITGTWAWEVPCGRVEAGESAAEAAAREFEEETGWRPGPLEHLIDIQPTPGISDSVHHIYLAREAAHVGSPADSFESELIAWVPLANVRELVAKGQLVSGSSVAALLYVLGG